MINNQTTLLLGKNYIQADKFATELLNQKTKEVEKNYIQTSWWAVAKFMINGRIYLKKVEEKGPSHLWNKRKMFEYIKEG